MRGEGSTARSLLLSAGIALAGLAVMSVVLGLAWLTIR